MPLSKTKLANLLNQHKLTDLAKITGLSYATLSKLAKSNQEINNMKLTTLCKLAKGLRMSVADLTKEIYLP
jgi:transcriptional regulator with XRE-family HTH domain